MARGEGGKSILEEGKEHFDFLNHLGEVCGSHDRRIQVRLRMEGIETGKPGPTAVSEAFRQKGIPGGEKGWHRTVRNR